MTTLHELLDAVEAELRAQADGGAAPKMISYMKDQFPFLGVAAPTRRKAQKPLIAAARRADPDDLLRVAERAWSLDEREFQYVGCDLLRAGAKHLRATDLGALRTFVQTRSWWDTVDALAAHPVGTVVAAHPHLGATMDEWIDDPDIWVARTAILHQLTYKERTDGARLFGYAVKRAADKEFFTRKALGWSLRTYAEIQPAAVRAFVDSHADRLSGLTIREATKHL